MNPIAWDSKFVNGRRLDEYFYGLLNLLIIIIKPLFFFQLQIKTPQIDKYRKLMILNF